MKTVFFDKLLIENTIDLKAEIYRLKLIRFPSWTAQPEDLPGSVEKSNGYFPVTFS